MRYTQGPILTDNWQLLGNISCSLGNNILTDIACFDDTHPTGFSFFQAPNPKASKRGSRKLVKMAVVLYTQLTGLTAITITVCYKNACTILRSQRYFQKSHPPTKSHRPIFFTLSGKYHLLSDHGALSIFSLFQLQALLFGNGRQPKTFLYWYSSCQTKQGTIPAFLGYLLVNCGSFDF